MRKFRLIVAMLAAGLWFSAGVMARPFLAGLWPSPVQQISPRASQQTALPHRAADLVMLGDSLVDHGRWDELLPWARVANRGIGRDTVLMLSNRLDGLPEGRIYLMIGSNDIAQNTPEDRLRAHLDQVFQRLEGRDIVVQSVLGPADVRTDRLNQTLRAMARDRGLTFLDLRPVLGRPLRAGYSYDGTHLTGAAYLIWAQAIADHFAAHPPRPAPQTAG